MTGKAKIPLETKWKILSLVFPVFMIFILSGTFKAEGYHQKASDFIRWNIYGLVMYSAFVLVLSIVSNYV